jgi:hypothetical protein
MGSEGDVRTRKDANHAEIVQALKEAHLSVIDLADVPANVRHLAGLPDLIVGGHHQRHGIPYAAMIEIKTDTGGVRSDQTEFAATWRGPYALVRNREEALAVFGIKW